MDVILICPKCPTTYVLYTENIELAESGDLIFTPEPVCPKCGCTGDAIISNDSQEEIDDMVFTGRIKPRL